MHLASKFGREFVDQFCNRKGFRNLPGKIPHSGEVPYQEGKDLVRIHERAGAVHGPNAVTIAIGGKSCIVFAGGDSPLQRSEVRFYRFRMRSTKTRIARTANFVAYNRVTQKKFR